MNYRVIIPAAGQGKRMQAGQNKQFIVLKDKPVIVHTLLVFQQDPDCQEVILVINEKEKIQFQTLIEQHGLSKVSRLVNGGAERQQSVFNGLKALRDEQDDNIVIVHDGARPFVTRDKIKQVVTKAAATGAAVLAVPIKDTLKRSRDGSVITETVDRSQLWAAQTPQAFRYSLLYAANVYAEEQGTIATDDASLVEAYGADVALVLGDETNIKLTTQADLTLADMILTWKKGNR